MQKNIFNLVKKHFSVVLFLIGYFVLIAGRMMRYPTPFYDWDESIYAQVGREMIRNKSFFVPLWQGAPWLDKPPIPSFFYGLIQLIPVSPEISTRLATLLLSCITLLLFYALVHKITKDSITSFLSVVFTSFLPIYFQRSQALNVDVFLLIGWLGYVYYFKNKKISTGFLILAVLSKSLLGLFPPAMFLIYYTYGFIKGHVKKKEFLSIIKQITLQVFLASLWFIGMLVAYKYPFIQYQFIDSHFKRVASSIEQHFGQRTFYITVLLEQLKLLLIPAVFSIIVLTFSFFRKREKYLPFLGLLFVPWFIFLNLTKTKIEWYIYPVLPQFAALAAYPVSLIRKKPYVRYALATSMIVLYFSLVTPIQMLLTKPFSSWEDHQLIAIAAKNNECRSLKVLVGNNTRTSYATLKSMDLVITTTTWWGNHPSIAYYADTNTTFLYDMSQALGEFNSLPINACMIVEREDSSSFPSRPGVSNVSSNKTYLLYKAI